jgi:serine/threonine protein kinase
MRSRVEELFHEVVDLSAEDRDRRFAEANVAERTRTEVQALLEYDRTATHSLHSSFSQAAEEALAHLGRGNFDCGPYRLGELVGTGGMGSVHLAERVDGEVTQRVAVKLLRPGADTPTVRQRFLSERQILATLSHSNIARLLDAGHREDGQPYLVMEYVEGKPIDAYASELGVREKLTLFVKVCAAVSYLHRNLVVHRDLKPPNILVTAEGEPKLLDFGIAKMLDFSTDATMTGMRMLTPDYASPEQAAGLTVTTATDVYSLGAVLYKLLTGASPHRLQGSSMEEVVLAISEGEIIPPARISAGLRGDLDFVVMKALRKDPQERYATVQQFAEDLENVLESRPIRARNADKWYRAGKFLRRYWLPIVASSAAVAGLSAGSALIQRERTIAQRRFTDVREIANKLLDIDASVRDLPGSTKARQLIVDTSLQYLKRLADDVRGDPELALQVGNAYMRVARVQGVPISPNLGQMDEAERGLRIAQGFIDSVLAANPANRTALLRSAQIDHDQMLLARLNGKPDTALALARKSVAALEKFDTVASDKPEAVAVLTTYLNVADQLVIGRQYDEALKLSRRAVDVCHVLGSRSYVGTFLWISAEVYRVRGDLENALRVSRESVQALDMGPAHPESGIKLNFVYALTREGRILGEPNAVSLGRSAEAVAALDRAFAIADGFVHRDADDQSARGRLAVTGILMADILRSSEPLRSLEIYNHTLRHMAEIKRNPSFRRYEVRALTGSTYPLRYLGRSDEARKRLDSAFETLRSLGMYPTTKTKPRSEVAESLCALGDHEASQGNTEKAIGIYSNLLAQVEAWGPKPQTDLTDAVSLSRLMGTLAQLQSRAHHYDLASAMETERLKLWRVWDARLPKNEFVTRQLRAAVSISQQ